jgi:uncharacterized protein
MKKTVPPFLFGVIFALGLGISGMTQPQKIVGFLDIFGNWDPSLAWVMIGAILVHSISYRLIVKRKSPLMEAAFSIPQKTDLEPNLIIGAVLFGIGWSLAGYCPGPAITSVVTLSGNTILFVAAMIGGMAIFKFQQSPKANEDLA